MAITRKRKGKDNDDDVAIPIAPMIDCVFLMLIYFMVSSTLQRQEADLAFQLPGTVEQNIPVEMPDEQIIEITEQGQIIVNDFFYDSPEAVVFTQLAAMLSRFRQACDANQVDAFVVLAPADDVQQQSVIKTLDAIAYAGIKSVNFSLQGGI